MYLGGEPGGTTRQPAVLWQKVGGSRGAVTPALVVSSGRPGPLGREIDRPLKLWEGGL